jgi:uncharacterized protein YjbJ (UPF0337 family)
MTVGLQFTVQVFSDIKSSDFHGNCFFNQSARHLQKGIGNSQRVGLRDKNNNRMQHDMSAHEVLGNWNIKKRKLKEKCEQLTVANLQFNEGNEDDLSGRVQKRSSHARKKFKRAVDEECDYKL